MTYPNGGTTPTTSVVDRGVHTLVQAHQPLAYTGSDVFGWAVLAVLLVVVGLLLLWACRAGWRRLG